MNTQQDIVNTLESKPFLSEDQLFKEAFGFDRNNSRTSNKKYAELLRRTMKSGKVDRVEASVKGNKSRYFYYVTK